VFLSAGVFDQNSDVTVELNGATATGDQIDLDATFGANDATRLRFDGFWRFADRHKVRALWFAADVKKTRSLSEDIQWGDEIYPAGTAVTVDREFSIYELAYEYAFFRHEKMELAGSLGLHFAKFSAELAANLEVPGDPGQTRHASGTARMNAPLPVIGVHGIWNAGGNFWIDGGAQLFALSFDKYDGHLVDYRLAALWQPKKWLGIGVGYDRCDLDLDIDGEAFNGSLEWTYSGPQIFLSATF
jgi:hypothetical protein